jgi:5-bromo-4-chloroindolyl phosphate hydrolysis protein
MRRLITTVWRILLSGTISIVSLVVFFFLIGKGFMPAFFASVAVFFLSMWVTGRRSTVHEKTYDFDLDKHDRAYIKQNLQDAWKKLKTIRRLQFRIRSIPIWQKTSHLYKVARRILSIIEEEPHRFHSARSFFSSYLDSTITILEKYTMLVSQPVRNTEIMMALKKTEAMLDDIIHALEEELMQVLSDDVLNLNVELDTLKKSLVTRTSHVITLPEHNEHEDKIKR